ncbi:PEPxxWA-CTERM sorting domain-containing protein [Phenylobacterium sp.]|uniref:PEPxxWA-CTERM sorting domain-containing protein n=1 Tax=Phenylobacterium sp. TaxID=1871053 RepID=UPI0025F5A0DD|nr:PEPxxWA-CTERM sorting domain-containing protein [Phenylobacterium sp.]MBX3485685.1 PEP-CTERM sorting domain-containing protein [Phenylobacterium sp.]
MKFSAMTAGAALAFGVVLAGGAAQADTLYTLAAPTGALATPGFIDAVFLAGPGAGSVSFQIQGYATLDGENCCTDTFTLSLNSVALLSGSWGLGGGGGDALYFSPAGSTVNVVNGVGGTVTITAPLTFVNGSNTLRFAYSGGSQGLGDEGWGLNSVVVTGSAVQASVPEPATWAMMLIGFGALGVSARRMRRVQALAG